MWASIIIKAFSGLVSLVGMIMQARHDNQLRDDGAARESLKQHQEAANAHSLADEIDRRPVGPADGLLNRLRKPGSEAGAH